MNGPSSECGRDRRVGRNLGRAISDGQAGKTPVASEVSYLLGTDMIPVRDSVCRTPMITTKIITNLTGYATRREFGSESENILRLYYVGQADTDCK